MNEYIELLDKNSKPNGKRCLKSIAHKNGYYHSSVHIWFYTKDKQVLIQKRHKTKNTFPNLWDVSVAGHISYQETPIYAAIREIEEEIGLKIIDKELRNIGTSRHKHIHSTELTDYELHHLYLGKLDIKIENLKIQEDEVAQIKLIPIDVLRFELKNNRDSYVPHGSTYYNRIFDAIKQFT
ncbi:NUDIX domain-containing protein [Flavicella sp.]|uniref:NUDIX hydrolase n=1 Tax=Flavicella sp. TaxID=2957742 RepID=UPI003015ABE0